jgi:hypothetical protein
MKRKRWKSLTVSTDFFDGCTKQPAEYILAESYERKIYFLDCENIAFQDIKGQDIWSTTGNGEIDLPAEVGVYIVRGKWKPG